MRDIIRRGQAIYHLLYGEDTFCYLASFHRLAKKRRARLVATFHQPATTFEQVYRRPELLGRLDGIIALSHDQGRLLRRLSGRENVHVIPHGIDTDFFFPGAEAPGKAVRCLFVGSWLRDLPMLSAVTSRIAAECPDILVEVVSDREGLPQSPNVVIRNQLSDDELRETYRRADLLLLPLLDSSANNSILEALACGLPVVATRVGGVEDYLDSSCAALTPPGDVGEMCKAVISLAKNEERRRHMASAARERARQLDWAIIARKTLEVYSEIS